MAAAALAMHFALAAPAWPPRWRMVPTNWLGIAAANALGLQPAQGGPMPPRQHVPTIVNGTPAQQPRKRVRFWSEPVTSIRTFPNLRLAPPCLKSALWHDGAAKN